LQIENDNKKKLEAVKNENVLEIGVGVNKAHIDQDSDEV
jgi:hypothetical protein